MDEQDQTTTAQTNEPKSKMGLYIIVLVALIAIAGFAYFNMSKSNSMNKEENMEMTTSSAPTEPSPTPDAMMMDKETTGSASQAVVINLEAGSFYFKPNVIKVKKGDTVKVIVSSKDMMHDFNIDEFNVHMPIVKSGNTGTVEFVASKAGTFEFYCSVGEHRKMGQVGTLTVE